MDWGSGVKNLTARIAPDMLGSKMGTKMVPVGALNAPTISKCTALRGEAVRDDGRSPNPLFWIETAGFWVDIFGRFLVDFFGVPLTKEKLPFCHGVMILTPKPPSLTP